ncbi:MAG: hypothetical protein OXG05_13850 [Gammaproteobacteria bacterium]|nr:hypothetical protein [Gammaproteobacteria bacterium]
MAWLQSSLGWQFDHQDIIVNDWGVLIGVLIGILGTIAFIFKIGEWKGLVDSDRSAFRDFMSEIRQKVDDIWKGLGGSPVTESASPIQLTDFGRVISKEIEATKWAAETVPLLRDRLADKTRYEIQEYCDKYVNEAAFADATLEFRAHEIAFNHGIKLENIANVLSVVLRDALLKEFEM